MADPSGFLHVDRKGPTRRPVDVRILDWNEVYEPFPLEAVQQQARRCMDCGIPFCHNGCPLGNLIPEWNDQARTGHWEEAIERLHATNNFPEFTGRLCPAPCEASCVLGIGADPVSIKQVEVTIIDKAWDNGLVHPQPPAKRTGRRVAVIGSGPAGLAAAQQLTRAGHDVTVYERADRIGGLLRYGIPEFKMEKAVLDRRLRQMRAEGTSFVTECEVGIDVTVGELKEAYEAIVIATGSTIGRGLSVPGGDLPGVHLAMEFLPQANAVCEGDSVAGQILATDRHVVIIGGGDTGADCLGTSHRQGAKSVTQLEIMPMPPESRAASTPWPMWPLMMRSGSAHEEGGERVFAVNTTSLTAGPDGRVAELHLVEVGPGFTPIEGTERTLPADLVLLAMGFTGPERPLLEQLGVSTDERGNVARTAAYATDVEGVFVCGDAGRGQSLIVWAIAEGRSAAAAVDTWLEGDTTLPAPLVAAATLTPASA